MRIRSVAGAVFALTLGLGGASGAATNYPYGTQVGTNFNFVGTNETVQTDVVATSLGPIPDDTTALFEAPTVIGDQLVFSPTSFNADSSNALGNPGGDIGVDTIDETHSTLQTTITSTNPAAFIESILIEEAGDIILGAFPPSGGTAATGGFATLSGTVEILAAINTTVIGQIVNFGGGIDFDTTFLPGPSTNFIFRGLPGIGSSSWTASVDIDLESLFPGAGITSAILTLNNYLSANSETGTSANIQKKAVDGPTITVVPEPGTAALLICGLFGLALRARRS